MAAAADGKGGVREAGEKYEGRNILWFGGLEYAVWFCFLLAGRPEGGNDCFVCGFISGFNFCVAEK